MAKIPLAQPDISEEEIAGVARVLRSGRLSLGPRLDEFESALARRCACPGAVAVSSGTAALDLCLQALNIGPGDEVITPSFTFVATVNAIARRGATPVFVDICRDTMNMDYADLARCVSDKTRAVIVVHLFGRPVDMNPILEFCHSRHLKVIEDACEALGATSNGGPVGSLGHCGVFGFYPNKLITTGEGGAIVSQDPELLALCRALRNHGRKANGFLSDRLGHNYRLSEPACALGVGQLARLDEFLERRSEAATRYRQLLAEVPGISMPPPNCAHGRIAWFVFILVLDAARPRRDQLIARMGRKGIELGNYFPAVHQMDFYRQRYPVEARTLPVTKYISGRTVALPFFSAITADQQETVAEELARVLGGKNGPE
ncbi:MAG: DegT/DnrJ/EryC1/StrS family aminotransferase [Gammaproteobacteria bacterium]|nr:DegT/DnrJ/EryC1/StrS family aminotransferase [Gammaproteobacteria bacterium]